VCGHDYLRISAGRGGSVESTGREV
jgi:hypothetical protein